MAMVRVDSISPEETLHSRLASWKAQFNQNTLNLNNIEFGSTAWERQGDRTWAEYDEWERVRIAGGFARLSWQDGVERDRRRYEDSKNLKSKSTTLTADDWSHAPLGMILENYLRGPVCAGQCDMARALERWHKFREVIAEQREFERSLSYSQKVSWTLLTHWWSAAYQDPSLSKAAIVLLEAAKASPNEVKYFHNEPHLNKETFIQSRKSLYNSTMYALFNKEFNPYFWWTHFKDVKLMMLKLSRVKCIEHATAQRLAYTSYTTIKKLGMHDADPYTGSADRPCPWLPRKDGNKEYPYFLWDVQLKRTVIVKDLSVEPEYCCVSHTWGRWRMDKVFIEGVPWLVPRNQRFDVESLPEHLKRIRTQTPFLWIDLFCIPQDRSPKAEEEINRQAVIFQNASRCIAWMNDVNEWTRTLKALDWIGISYLHASTSFGIYETEGLLEPLYREATKDCEIYTQKVEVAVGEKHPLDPSSPRPVVAIGARKLAEPACWFSSLWTLQEAMLCPNLTFISRHWIHLEDRRGTPIPLDAFFKILNALENIWDNDRPYQNWTDGRIEEYSSIMKYQDMKWPDGARQLYDLCLVTRMADLLESPEPAKLLMVANTRQSTGSRAPAIMSALGITDWYKPNEIKHRDANLVLNCYPLAFVKEAAAKIGAAFYGSGGNVKKPSLQSDTFNHSTKGSMMPFSAESGWFATTLGIPVTYGHTTEDHPAVKTWNIKQDGSVEIKQAGIVASTEKSPNDESFLRVFHEHKDKTPIRFIDWVNDLPKDMCMFAVILVQSSGWQKGLVLRGYRKGRFSLAQRLLKAGTFVIPDFKFPPATNVNWLVW